MNIRNLIASLTLATACIASAQITPRSIFTTAPTELFPSIDKTTRLDMLDYAESGSKHVSNDLFGQDVLISEIDSNRLVVDYGFGSTIEFVVLPAGKKEYILMIKRVATPAIDSQVCVFDSRWVQIPASKVFTMPKLDDWLKKEYRDRRIDVENALPFIMINATYDPASTTLTLTPDFNGYISREDSDLVNSAIRPFLTYTWNGKKFTLNKPR